MQVMALEISIKKKKKGLMLHRTALRPVNHFQNSRGEKCFILMYYRFKQSDGTYGNCLLPAQIIINYHLIILYKGNNNSITLKLKMKLTAELAFI